MTQDRCTAPDFGVFLALWNATQNQSTPPIHFRIAIWLQKCWERGHRRLLLQAFRASGKSTLVGIFCGWILCRHPDTRILVLSAESMLAEKMVQTIRKIIEKHPLTQGIRPNNPDQWAADSFTIRRERVSRDPSVLARGIYANITGTRADLVICDDVEVPNTCDTADKRAKLRERLTENDFILTPGGTQLYIGTPHSYFSIYADQPRGEAGEESIFLKDYKRLSIPIVGRNGESQWPERYDARKIEDMRKAAGPMKFAAQMMLKPVSIIDGRLKPALLRRYSGEPEIREAQGETILTISGRRMVSASAWWDPSFGAADGDSSVLAIVFADAEGDYFLHRVSYLHVHVAEDADEAGEQCRLVAEIARHFHLPSIAVETNGIGKFLPSILRREIGCLRIGCAVTEQYSQRSKADRILEAFDAVMAARSLHVHASVYDTPFITEMTEWKPGGKGMRDDGLDAVAGALSLQPVRISRSFGGMARKPEWMKGAALQTAQTDFDV